MIKTKYILFGFISLNSLINGMILIPSQIKPDSLAPRLIRLAEAHGVDHNAITIYSFFHVTPDGIKTLVKENDNPESYAADIGSNEQILCTYFSQGEFAGQIWAFVNTSIHFSIPIPQENFFTLRALYAKQKAAQLDNASPATQGE